MAAWPSDIHIVSNSSANHGNPPITDILMVVTQVTDINSDPIPHHCSRTMDPEMALGDNLGQDSTIA